MLQKIIDNIVRLVLILASWWTINIVVLAVKTGGICIHPRGSAGMLCADYSDNPSLFWLYAASHIIFLVAFILIFILSFLRKKEVEKENLEKTGSATTSPFKSTPIPQILCYGVLFTVVIGLLLFNVWYVSGDNKRLTGILSAGMLVLYSLFFSLFVSLGFIRLHIKFNPALRNITQKYLLYSFISTIVLSICFFVSMKIPVTQAAFGKILLILWMGFCIWAIWKGVVTGEIQYRSSRIKRDGNSILFYLTVLFYLFMFTIAFVIAFIPQLITKHHF